MPKPSKIKPELTLDSQIRAAANELLDVLQDNNEACCVCFLANPHAHDPEYACGKLAELVGHSDGKVQAGPVADWAMK